MLKLNDLVERGRLGLLLALLAAALPARADVSDSGALTLGGQAVIAGTATVQGGSFSVGGATFTVSGGSVTLGGRLNLAAAGIKWADGTTSTTAASGGGGSGFVNQSTFTAFPQFSFTNTTFAAGCVTNSTVTMTTSGSQVLIYFYGNVTVTGGNYSYFNVLMDGSFVSPFGSSQSAGVSDTSSGLYQKANMHIIRDVSPGTHSWCLMVRNNGGGSGYIYNDANFYNQFGVIELK